jgi:hypothetical protein
MKPSRHLPSWRAGPNPTQSPITRKLHPGNYRHISQCKTIYKLLTLILNTCLLVSRKTYWPLSKQPSWLHDLLEYLHTQSPHSIPFLALFLDLEKTYDSLPHNTIPFTLSYYSLNKKATRLISKLSTNTSTKYGLSDPFDRKCQVKQGDLLSPLIWNLFTNPLAHWLLSHSRLLLTRD